MKLFNSILAFLFSTKPNHLLLKTVFALIVFYFMCSSDEFQLKREGFTQNENFILKQNEKAYDEFYAPIYEYLYNLHKRTAFETEEIILATQPDQKKSVFLDVGCGTGLRVHQLAKQGYSCYGLDISEDMVNYGLQKYDKLMVKCGDAMNALEYEPSSFTHILCMNFTIYQFQDKKRFFQNCCRWLLPHSYLIIHLVKPSQFNPITHLGRPALLHQPQKYAKERITDTAIDFTDFKYKSHYDFEHVNEGKVYHKETFVDGESGHVRQNEYVLYMEDEEEILDLAEKCGFTRKGQFSMAPYDKDEHQNVYILERTHMVYHL